MEKSFPLEGLDCAACAQKMEDAVRKIDGVQGVSVNFLFQKMTIEAEQDRFFAIMKQVKKTCKKVEPDCSIDC